MLEQYFVYMMSSTKQNVLYIGVTNNLNRRIAEHKGKIESGFTAKYNCENLVYFEIFERMDQAIAREKQLKNWKREWKDNLINENNREWKDLSKEIGITEEYIESVKEHYKKKTALRR